MACTIIPKERSMELTELERELQEIKENLKLYNQLLDTHIKRTDALELYIKDNDENWKNTVDRLEKFQENQQAFTLKMLAGIGTFIGVLIPLMLQLLKEI